MPNNDHIETALSVLNDVLSDIATWDAQHNDLLNTEIAVINGSIEMMQIRIAHMHDNHQILENGHCVCEELDKPMQEEIL